MAALEGALRLWVDVDQQAIVTKSSRLFAILTAAGDALRVPCVSPRAAQDRGSHISFRHPAAYQITRR